MLYLVAPHGCQLPIPPYPHPVRGKAVRRNGDRRFFMISIQ